MPRPHILFPRVKTRGPIEAFDGVFIAPTFRRFPRVKTRGPIEAKRARVDSP